MVQSSVLEALTETSYVVRASHLMATTVQQDVVLLDAEAGKYYGFDAVGSDIWAELETPVLVDELCSALMEKYTGDPASIRHDVMVLLKDMLRAGLIVLCPQ